jgi:Spy/CpxP family protein refolding chaperone
MRRLVFPLVGSLTLLLAVGLLKAQDTKDTKDSSDKEMPTKGKTLFPPKYSQLGLTEDQRQKVLKIHQSYKSRLDALHEQIEELTKQERAELNKILDDRQRLRLSELDGKKSKKDSTVKGTDTKKDEAKAEKKEDTKDDKKEDKK